MFTVRKFQDGQPLGKDETFEDRYEAEARFEALLEGAKMLVTQVDLVSSENGGSKCCASGGYDEQGNIILLGERDEISHPEVSARIQKPERETFVVTLGDDTWKLSRKEADSLFDQLVGQGIGGNDGNKDEIKR